MNFKPGVPGIIAVVSCWYGAGMSPRTKALWRKKVSLMDDSGNGNAQPLIFPRWHRLYPLRSHCPVWRTTWLLSEKDIHVREKALSLCTCHGRWRLGVVCECSSLSWGPWCLGLQLTAWLSPSEPRWWHWELPGCPAIVSRKTDGGVVQLRCLAAFQHRIQVTQR